MESEKTLYEILGGEPSIRFIADRFYYYMETLPEVRIVRDMHPADMSTSSQKLFEFLSGWLGGPQLFVQKHGHPRLRARHLPFKIGMPERDMWLLCIHKALVDLNPAPEVRQELMLSLGRLADHMRNQEDH